MSDAKYYQISSTADSQEHASELARSVVESRLAACAQVVGPINSTYWWEGRVDTSAEWLVLFKTAATKSDELVDHIKQHHTYDVPEIIVTPVTGGNPEYLAWVDEETRPR